MSAYECKHLFFTAFPLMVGRKSCELYDKLLLQEPLLVHLNQNSDPSSSQMV